MPTGRPVLATSDAYDRLGPREIVLSDAGMSRLGGAALAAVGGAVVLLALAWLALPVAVGALVLAVGALNTRMRPRASRWLDGLGRTLDRSLDRRKPPTAD